MSDDISMKSLKHSIKENTIKAFKQVVICFTL